MAKGEVLVANNGKARPINDEALSEEIRKAYKAYLKIKSMEAELSERKRWMLRRARRYLTNGASLTSCGIKCSISKRHERRIPEENVKKLRALLGGRFNRYIHVQKVFIPERGLTQMSGAKKLIRVKELSPRFTWEKAGK